MSTEKWTFTRSTTGATVKLVLTEGDLTVSWTAKTYASQIGVGVEECKRGAYLAMGELRVAIAKYELAPVTT